MTEQQTSIEGLRYWEAIKVQRQEIARLHAIMSDIYRLVHIPTSGHMRAYTHFQRDFDQIRAMTKPFAEDASAKG